MADRKHAQDEVIVDNEPGSGDEASGGHSDEATARDAASSPAHGNGAEEAKAFGSNETMSPQIAVCFPKLVRVELVDMKRTGWTLMSQHMRFLEILASTVSSTATTSRSTPAGSVVVSSAGCYTSFNELARSFAQVLSTQTPS